jgi:hypothetical protein
MHAVDSFSKGWELYRGNFTDLLVLNALRFLAFIGFLAASLLMSLPFIVSGILMVIDSPDAALSIPSLLQVSSFFLSFLLVVAAAFILLLPLFLYPHLAGAVLAHSRKEGARWKESIALLRKSYHKLLLGTVVYWFIAAFLFTQSLFLSVGSLLPGLLMFLLAVYVSVRLTFWDVLALTGEAHPLTASWEITRGNFMQAFLFVLLANIIPQMCFLIPGLGFFICLLLVPWVAASKVVFVAGSMKGFNKNRRNG